MPYRSDQTALRVRKLALENELRGLEVRAEQARQIMQLESETKRELENIDGILGATKRNPGPSTSTQHSPHFAWPRSLRPLTTLAGAIGLLLCGGASTAYTMWLVDSTTLAPLDDLRDAQQRVRTLQQLNRDLERELAHEQTRRMLSPIHASHPNQHCDPGDPIFR